MYVPLSILAPFWNGDLSSNCISLRLISSSSGETYFSILVAVSMTFGFPGSFPYPMNSRQRPSAFACIDCQQGERERETESESERVTTMHRSYKGTYNVRSKTKNPKVTEASKARKGDIGLPRSKHLTLQFNFTLVDSHTLAFMHGDCPGEAKWYLNSNGRHVPKFNFKPCRKYRRAISIIELHNGEQTTRISIRSSTNIPFEPRPFWVTCTANIRHYLEFAATVRERETGRDRDRDRGRIQIVVL